MPWFPWQVVCFVLVLVLVLLLPGAWRVLRPDRIKTQSPVQADPVQAWQNAIEKSALGRYVHAARGSRLLLEAFYAMPATMRGWRLRQAECAAQADRKSVV